MEKLEITEYLGFMENLFVSFPMTNIHPFDVTTETLNNSKTIALNVFADTLIP